MAVLVLKDCIKLDGRGAVGEVGLSHCQAKSHAKQSNLALHVAHLSFNIVNFHVKLG